MALLNDWYSHCIIWITSALCVECFIWLPRSITKTQNDSTKWSHCLNVVTRFPVQLIYCNTRLLPSNFFPHLWFDCQLCASVLCIINWWFLFLFLTLTYCGCCWQQVVAVVCQNVIRNWNWWNYRWRAHCPSCCRFVGCLCLTCSNYCAASTCVWSTEYVCVFHPHRAWRCKITSIKI